MNQHTLAIVVGIIVAVVIILFGLGRWLVRDTKAQRAADRRDGVMVRFEDLRVTGTHVLEGSYNSPARYPIAGLRAQVEDAGQIQKRITATRLATIGPFALALQKRKDDRSVFLTIVGPGVAIVREVPVRTSPRVGALARQFAAAVNAQALRAEDAA